MRRSAASSLPIENGIEAIGVFNGAPPSSGYCSKTGVCGDCGRMGSVRIICPHCRVTPAAPGERLADDSMSIKYRARFPFSLRSPCLLGGATGLYSRLVTYTSFEDTGMSEILHAPVRR